MILVAATTLTSASNYPGWLVAVPVVGTGLVIAGGTSQPRWGPETVLGRRPLQFLGLVSFSWYLWHWPILTIATEQNGNVTPSTADNVLLVLIALVVAIVTYAVLENPVRHWRALVSRRWASLLLGACLVAASLGVTTLAVRSTADTSISAIADAAPGTSCTTEAKAGLSQLRAHPRSSLPPLRTTPPDQTLEMLVIGDSTACTMVAGLTVEGQRYRIHVINGAVIGCGIVSGQIPAYYSEGVDVFAYTKQCQSDADRVEAYALRHAQPDIVLWDSTREMESIVAHTRSGPVDLAVGTPEWTAEMHRRIDARITQLMATGAKVIVVLQAPTVEGPMTHGNTSIDRAYAAMNALLRTETRLHRDQVGVVDLATYVCPSGPPCPYVVHGTVLRGDELHYSPAASLQVATWLVPQILEAARKLPG